MTQAAVQTWLGRSDEIAVPLLGAEFWKEGTEVTGIFEGFREQKVGGPAAKLTLDVPLTIDEVEELVIELPSLTGIKYALMALRQKGYQSKRGDMWRVCCTGIKKARKEGFSDSPEFLIEVIRKAAAAA